MNILKYSLLMLLGLALFAGCESKVTEETIDKKQDRIATLEEDLKEARANGDSSERIAELEAELSKRRDELAALEQRWEYEKKMEAQLRDLDRNIDRLQAKAADASGEAEVDLRKKVAELRTLYDQLEEKMNELRVASGDAWEDSKEAVEEGWKQTSDRVQKVLDDLPEMEKQIDEESSEEKDDQTDGEDK